MYVSRILPLRGVGGAHYRAMRTEKHTRTMPRIDECWHREARRLLQAVGTFFAHFQLNWLGMHRARGVTMSGRSFVRDMR